MIWDHPAVGQINIFLKLNGDHLRIDLDHSPDQPIVDTVATPVMVTHDLNLIADVIGFYSVGSRLKVELCQPCLLKIN
jgi:hypothetical protein